MKRVAGAAALAAIILLLAGVPVALVWLAGPFLPTTLPSLDAVIGALTARDDGTVLMAVLYLIAWAAWAWLAIALLAEIWATLRHNPAPKLPGFPQGLARRLVGATVVLFVSVPAIAANAASPFQTQITPPAATALTQTAPAPAEGQPPAAAQPQVVEHTVGPKDTLSGLAEQYLGDADRYPEIFALNQGMIQANGRPLTNPDLIVDGTVLRIQLDAPETPTPPAPETTAPSSPEVAAVVPQVAAPITPAPSAPAPMTSAPSMEASATQTASPAIAVDADDEDRAPMVTSFGAGAVLAAGVVGAISSARWLQRRRRRKGTALAMPAGAAAVIEQELRAVSTPMTIAQMDHGLRLIAEHCRAMGQELPAIRVARLMAGGCELYLEEPAELPAPWSGVADRLLWALNVDDITIDDRLWELPAPYPALVTIGQDAEDAHVLLDLEYIRALGIDQSRTEAEGILAALAIELASSPWADDITITMVGAFAGLEDALDTGRIRYLPTLGRLLEELRHRADVDRAAMVASNTTSIRAARVTGRAPSTWYPEVLLLTQPLTDQQRKQLHTLLAGLPHVAMAAVTLGEYTDWTLTPGKDHHLLKPLELAITPQQVPPEVYWGIIEITDIAHHGQDIENQITPAAVSSLIGEATDILTQPTRAADQPLEPATEQNSGELVVPARSQDIDVVAGPVEDQPYLRLMGPISLDQAPGPVEQKRRRRLIEYLAYLMLTDQPTIAGIDEAIWPGRRTQDNTATRNSATSRLRKWLGNQQNSDEPRLVPGTYHVLDVGCDWLDFNHLTNGKLAELPTSQLQAAVELIQGPILEGSGIRYWGWAEPCRQAMITRAVDVCYELALRELLDEDYLGCEATLAKVLGIEPGDEQLWRMRILAAYARRNSQAVQEAIDRLYTTLEVFECDPEEQTETFLSALKNGAPVNELLEMI